MSENSNIAGKCQRCGATLAADAPEGLCPRCLMALNLATQTEVPGEEVGPNGTKVVKPAPPALGEIAKHFPQLEILECLGRGGMGVVYKARQPKLNRLVALKILAPEKEADPKFAERFLREAQTLARLNHPNIVTVHDFGEADRLYYLMMEYVDGVSLRQLLQTRKIPPEQALAIVPRICEALQFAHEQGVVHRDIKPENVLLDKQGRVKIADFGIAKIMRGTGQPTPSLSPSDGERGSSRTGQGTITQSQVIGTPHYMAPEQVEHPQAVDHRADIYSLGVVFYEMLTGELPLGKFQPPSKKVQIDVRLDEVVLHALEKEPERRYQHVSQVKTDVETIATTAPPPGSSLPIAASYHKAPWSPMLVLGSSLCSVLCLGLAMKFFINGTSSSVLIGLFLLALTFGCALFSVRGYTITKDVILVHRLFWATRLPLDGLKSARFELGAMQWGIRFGNGGFFSFTGYRYNRTLGWHRAFVTDQARTVVLRYANRTVVVSPADPEAFVRDLSLSIARPKGRSEEQELEAAQRARLLRVKAGVFAFTAVCGLIGALLLFQKESDLPSVLSAIGMIGFGVAAYRHARAAARVAQKASPGMSAWLRRNLISDDTAARWAQWACYVAALVIFVLGIWKLTTFELKLPELFLGVVLVVILTLLFAIAGLVIRPVVKTSKDEALDSARQTKRWRDALRSLLIGVAFVIGLRVFVLAPYRAATDSVSPELPQGSHFLVLKLVRSFAPGDIVVFRSDGKPRLARVTEAGPADGRLQIARQGEPPRSVAASDIVGRVILNTRGSAAGGPNVVVIGTVADALTGKLIAGARVDDNRYGASPGKTPQQAWTDPNGRFELKTWYEEHTLAASAAGYETKLARLLTKPVGSEREVRMDFQLQPANTNATFALGAVVQGVAISGRQARIQGRSGTNSCFVVSVGAASLSCHLPPATQFTATFEREIFGQGFNLFIQDSRGTQLEKSTGSKVGPMTTERGRIVLCQGAPQPEPDGSFVIGEFQPRTGAALPIKVRLEEDGEPFAGKIKRALPTNQLDPVMDRVVGNSQATNAIPDLTRALTLFNDIEDFSHEFDAAFSATNLAAAQTGTRRLLNLLTNFNAAVRGTDCEFPAALFDEIAKVRQALDEGAWDEARRAAAYNEEFARAFQRISSRMVELAQQQRQADPVSFGPVIERVLSGEGDKNRRFIDFDTGKQFAAAEFFGPKDEPSPEETQQWWEKTGIDAVGDTSPAIRGLVGFDMVAVPVPNEEWDCLATSRLDYYFTLTKPGTPVTMLGKNEPPATFAIKTRDGNQGLLQITGFTDDPPSIKIRYKLAQKAPAGASGSKR